MGKTRIKTVDESATEEKETPDTGNLKLDEGIQLQSSNPKKPTSSIKRPTSKKIRSKKYQEVSKNLDRTKSYSLDEAVDMVKKLSYAKFNTTLEAHINTAQTGLRGFISLPQAGKTEYKTEAKAPIIHLPLGKLDQPTEELSQNVKTLLQTLGKSRIKKVSLSPTMGPSVKVDLASLS